MFFTFPKKLFRPTPAVLGILTAFCSPLWAAPEGPTLLETSTKATASSTTSSATELQIKKLESTISTAVSKGGFYEAGAYQEAIAAQNPIVTQDDVRPLLEAGRDYFSAKEYDKAFALAEQAFSVPAAPGAQRPSMMSGPVDLRGAARWDMAEARRAQKRWAEALALYQLNRKTYPQDDGCVGSGEGFQRMALVEGICLENLGRFDEAVTLYWAAAISLSPDGGAPLAARRLVDVYTATNQLYVLQAAVTREKKNYPAYYRATRSIEPEAELTAFQQENLQSALAETGIFTFERILRFRQAAHNKEWHILLSTLHDSQTNSRIQPSLRRDALEALAQIPQESVPILQKALQIEPSNHWLQAALQICSALPAQGLGATLITKNPELSELLEMNSGNRSTPWQFPAPPPGLPLAATMPAVYVLG